MQVHIIIYIRTPACARQYAYTGINIHIIENLKANESSIKAKKGRGITP